MKINLNNVEVEGNMTFGESVKMGIDPRATALIIRHLTNLYSNPHIAALREYTSNAFDSHKVAGTTRPVEVILPDTLNPNLIIEDFGVGLDREGLRQYGQYGLSSKNESDDEIGGFGLGSKSGLAIASQFTVTATKDGFRNMAIIAFGEDGAPSLNFLNAEPTPTDAPNGVKITIPTTDASKFVRAISEDFFLGWTPDSITVDLHTPGASVHDASLYTPIPGHGWIKTILRENYYDRDGEYGTALVGPVKYKIKWSEAYPELDYELRKGYLSDVVVDLPIGSVDLTPSREDLIYSKLTREAIKEHVDAIRDHGKTIFQSRIDQATDFREAVKLADRARARGFKADYQFNGESLTAQPDLNPGNEVSMMVITEGWSTRSRSNTYGKDWSYANLSEPKEIVDMAVKQDNYVLITDATEVKQVARKKNWRTVYYMQHSVANAVLNYWQSGIEDGSLQKADRHRTKFVMTSRSQADLDPVVLKSFVNVVKAEDVIAVSEEFKKARVKARREALKDLPKVPKTLENTPVRWLMFNQWGNYSIKEGTLGDLDASKTYIHLENLAHGSIHDKSVDLAYRMRRALTTEVGKQDNRRLFDLVTEFAKDGSFIILLSNKSWATENYAKALPNITTFEKIVAKKTKKVFKSLTAMEIRAAQDREARNANWASSIDREHAPLIERKQTRDWLTAMNREATAKIEFVSRITSLAPQLGIDPGKYRITAGDIESPANRYPLLEQMWSMSSKASLAAVEYINMMDAKIAAEEKAARKAEKKAQKAAQDQYEAEFAALVAEEAEVAA